MGEDDKYSNDIPDWMLSPTQFLIRYRNRPHCW